MLHGWEIIIIPLLLVYVIKTEIINKQDWVINDGSLTTFSIFVFTNGQINKAPSSFPLFPSCFSLLVAPFSSSLLAPSSLQLPPHLKKKTKKPFFQWFWWKHYGWTNRWTDRQSSSLIEMRSYLKSDTWLRDSYYSSTISIYMSLTLKEMVHDEM